MKKAFLIYVEGTGGVNSNKYYNMEEKGDGTFDCKYGRVGGREAVANYPMSRWDKQLKSKVKKGYKDVTYLKTSDSVVVDNSSNPDFDKFYQIFSQYTGSLVNKTYLIDTCTPKQIKQAQVALNKALKSRSINEANEYLQELYKIIPRKMADVSHHLASDTKSKKAIVANEQTAIDTMDSSNIINTTNPLNTLNIDFAMVTDIKTLKMIEKLIMPSNTGRYRIHSVYSITQKSRIDVFNDWVKKQDNKSTELLIHGTRNPNIFSILQQGLLIRPSNAVHIAGNAYGNGVYHSAHTDKSIGYTGRERDALFLIQDVHMGNPYTYSGWYRDGKDISRGQMNYDDLRKLGSDSLYVKAGDGLLNSEYIVYNAEQTVTKFLIHLRY